MRFDIMTLFPELVSSVLGESIIGRAQKAGYVSVHAHNIRDFANNKHRKVDDTPYGGGFGMLMMAPPVYDCYEFVKNQVKEELGDEIKSKVIYMSAYPLAGATLKVRMLFKSVKGGLGNQADLGIRCTADQ